VADKKRDAERLAKRIGKRISDRRKSLGWTQDQLAERVRVDGETISRFERGANLPSLLTLDRLATVLRVDVGALLSRTEATPLDEMSALAMLIGELKESDRAFVAAQLRGWCEYLRSQGAR
jgi:transcriptional regulator with XRE-family HTH domain